MKSIAKRARQPLEPLEVRYRYSADYELLKEFRSYEKGDQRFTLESVNIMRNFFSEFGADIEQWLERITDQWAFIETERHSKKKTDEFQLNLRATLNLVRKLHAFHKKFPQQTPQGRKFRNESAENTGRRPTTYNIDAEQFKAFDRNERLFSLLSCHPVRVFFAKASPDVINSTIDYWLTTEGKSQPCEMIENFRQKFEAFLDMIDSLQELHNRFPPR